MLHGFHCAGIPGEMKTSLVGDWCVDKRFTTKCFAKEACYGASFQIWRTFEQKKTLR